MLNVSPNTHSNQVLIMMSHDELFPDWIPSGSWTKGAVENVASLCWKFLDLTWDLWWEKKDFFAQYPVGDGNLDIPHNKIFWDDLPPTTDSNFFEKRPGRFRTN